jgi:hypothetical protein
MMSQSRVVSLWAWLLLAAAMMVGAGSTPAEAHRDGFVDGPSGGRRGGGVNVQRFDHGGRQLLRGKRRFDHPNGRPVNGQIHIPAGARIEVFVDGRLVYSRRANNRFSIHLNENSRLVRGTGKGTRFVNGNGRLGKGQGGRFTNGSGRRVVPPSRAADGISSGGY